jgi:hypothetical protein
VRKVFFFVGFLGLVVGPAALGIACSSETPNDGRVNLPERNDAEPRDGATASDGAVAESCKDLTLKVGEPASCDNCAKDKCCSEVLACTKSSDCTELQECLTPCDQSDFLCIVTCQESHPKGNDTLSEVGRCAKSKCKAECPSTAPDAGIFDDSGL